MIFNKGIAVGFQCPVCGSIENQKIDIFRLSGEKLAGVKCGRCGGDELHFARRGGGLRVSVPCTLCGASHSYDITLDDFLSGKLKKFICPTSGETAFCVGNSDAVEKTLKNEFKESEFGIMYGAADDRGLGKYMPEIFEHLRDIALAGAMYCECGEVEIEAELLGSTLRFICPSCGAKFDVKLPDACSVKEFTDKREVILKR